MWCGNDSSLVPTTELSISAWFKTSATARQAIVSKTYYKVELESTSGLISFAVYRSASNGVFAFTPSGQVIKMDNGITFYVRIK